VILLSCLIDIILASAHSFTESDFSTHFHIRPVSPMLPFPKYSIHRPKGSAEFLVQVHQGRNIGIAMVLRIEAQVVPELVDLDERSRVWVLAL
jgi:hypothetical protein